MRHSPSPRDWRAPPKQFLAWNQNTGGASGLKDGIKPLLIHNVSDLLTQLAENTKGDGCGCVAMLEIVGHGHSPEGGGGLQIGWPNKSKPTLSDEIIATGANVGNSTYMDSTNVADIGQKLHDTGVMCKNCVIVLTGCNAGNAKNSVADELAAKTGCSVVAPGGFANGTFAAGTIIVTTDDAEVDQNVYNPPKANTWYLTLPPAPKSTK